MTKAAGIGGEEAGLSRSTEIYDGANAPAAAAAATVSDPLGCC